jgi:hypothetical protein
MSPEEAGPDNTMHCPDHHLDMQSFATCVDLACPAGAGLAGAGQSAPAASRWARRSAAGARGGLLGSVVTLGRRGAPGGEEGGQAQYRAQ